MEGEIKVGQFWPTFKYQEDFLKMGKNIFSPFAASSKSIIQNKKIIANDQVWETLMTLTHKEKPIFEFQSSWEQFDCVFFFINLFLYSEHMQN